MTAPRANLLRDSLVVFVNEVRIQFRDGHVLLSSLLLPLLLYPLVFWATGEFITVGKGSVEKTASRIGVAPGLTGEALVRRVGREKNATILPVEDGLAAVGVGDVDAYLDIHQNGAERAAVTVFYDASRPRSVRAKQRVDLWLVDARNEALADAFSAASGRRETAVVFLRDVKNVATPKEMGGFLLGLLLPLTMVGMTTMGAFYPAIDVLVGERERSTLEALLSSGASRIAIVAGKYLTVVMAALLAGTLNLGSMLLTAMQFLRAFGDVPGEGFSLPGNAVPILVLGSLLLGAFFGAAMILLASLARTFKEGQSLVTPFYSLSILPAMVSVYPGFHLTPGSALIPVANVALMMRGALQGELATGPFLLTVAWMLSLTVLLLMFAVWFFRQEDVLVGSSSGSLFAYLRRRFERPRPAVRVADFAGRGAAMRGKGAP